MGNVIINNQTNIVVNVALCIVIRYYEANQVLPGESGKWTGVGYVWFSIYQVPFYGADSEFGDCSTVRQKYLNEVHRLAEELSTKGTTNLGYLTFVGTNVTYAQATDRLRDLAYAGDGFKVAGKTITLWGGPEARMVRKDNYEIDLSEHFRPIEISLE